MDAAVSLTGVAKRAGSAAVLRDLDVSVAEGELCCIIGSRGAGRTTLLRLIAALLRPDQGSISVFGFDTVRDASVVQAVIGYVPQTAGIYDDLTVRENIRLHAALRGAGSDISVPSLGALSVHLDVKAAALSRAQQRSLALACATVGRPRLLLVDEPTNGLDTESRQLIGVLLRGFVRQGISVIWNTSYMDEAEHCDRALLLQGGRAIAQDTPRGLISRLAGRTSLIEVAPGRRHRIAAEFQRAPGVVDVDVRRNRLIVLADTADRTITIPSVNGVTGRPVAPRLDDAVFAVLSAHDPSRARPLPPSVGAVPPCTAPPLTARGLTLRSRRGLLVDNAELNVAAGEIVGLVGPHGAGKSLILRLLCGLVIPTSGMVRLSGHDLQSDRLAALAQLGYGSTAAPVYSDLAARHQLEFTASARGLSGPERARRVAQVLADLGLAEVADRRSGELSASLQWRLLLATMLIHRPRLLLLDNSSSPLDPVVRRLFWSDLSTVVAGGTGVLATSHLADDAEHCDRIIRLQDGRVISDVHADRFT